MTWWHHYQYQHPSNLTDFEGQKKAERVGVIIPIIHPYQNTPSG
jgi:hypothetical protein